MKTVDKALRLLGHFSVRSPDWGLSDLARAAGTDKATTLRLLAALARAGFVEQHPGTRRYRLGPEVLHLARIREATAPLTSIVEPCLGRLSAETGETAHASMVSGTELVQIGVVMPARSTRVHLDPAEQMRFHATASGLACLAFADRALVEAVIAAGLPALTPRTCTTRAGLEALLAGARAAGHAVGEQSFEEDVVGIAAPFFDAAGAPAGAVAVAMPAPRATPEARGRTARLVVEAGREITRQTGGTPHPDYPPRAPG